VQYSTGFFIKAGDLDSDSGDVSSNAGDLDSDTGDVSSNAGYLDSGSGGLSSKAGDLHCFIKTIPFFLVIIAIGMFGG